MLDDKLVSGLDLVTIQLSENANDLQSFKSDMEDLIKHVKEKCGSSIKIIIIDDFWSEEKSEIKKLVANESGIDFVDLSDIRNNIVYQLGIGSIIYDENGNKHVNQHSGVAVHPNDEGMKIIAERVLEKIK